MTTAVAASQSDTASIAGGWTTTGGDWSVPVRLTGDNGLMGKVMRGVTVWTQGGIDEGRPDGTDGYQGLEETDTSVIYYDVVGRVDANGNLTDLYYCIDGSDGGAAQYAPWTTQGANYWNAADQFDFVATKVLMASNAFIDIFSGNAAYFYDNDGPGAANPNIVAGIQGGSEDAGGNAQINFFAGTTGSNPNPQTAPFRVDYEGNLYATKGYIGPYIIDEEHGLHRQWVIQQGGTYVTQEGRYDMDEMRVYQSAAGTQRYVDATPEGITVYQSGITTNSGTTTITPTLISVTGGSSSGNGDIQRNGESVITSVDGEILHVMKLTQYQYDNLSSYDATTFYVIVE